MPARSRSRTRASSTRSDAAAPWAHLRLKDRISPGVRVLFVGINPGVRSAQTGHHFAGYSNRFWKLLFESGLVPERITWRDDDRLSEWGLGITNLIARPSPGIDDLKPPEYLEGWKALDRKVRRFRPSIVAFVGVTLYRALQPVLGVPRAAVHTGLQPLILHGARLFVLPNPSGRNAHFSYAEMLDAFKSLAATEQHGRTQNWQPQNNTEEHRTGGHRTTRKNTE